jgi:hypothetical protein
MMLSPSNAQSLSKRIWEPGVFVRFMRVRVVGIAVRIIVGVKGLWRFVKDVDKDFGGMRVKCELYVGSDGMKMG